MLDEHEKLVSVMKEVDVVISAVAYPQVLDQFKILEAIKISGNIKVLVLLRMCVLNYELFMIFC